MMLSVEQEARYDAAGTVVQAYAYLLNPTVVFEAPVSSYTMREGAFVALVTGTPTTGTLGAIKPEMTLYLHTGGGSRSGGSQRVRGVNLDTSSILIGRAAAGTGEGQICGEAGATVTVYDEYRPFTKAPFIAVLPSPVQYKDETLYPGHNLAQPPVANAGIDRLIITYGASASVVLNGSASYAVRAGAAITDYLWDVGDGAITVGDVDEATLTVSFPLGRRWISLRVTDSNGTTHTTHRLIAVARPDDCTPVRITSMAHTAYECSLSIKIDTEALTDLPPRAKVLIAERENYTDTLLPYAERFSGWLQEENSVLENPISRLHTTDIVVEDIGAFLKRNNLFPQSLNAVDLGGVGGWFRMRNANIDRMMHYLLHWHTNTLSFSSFSWSGEGATYPFTALTTSGGAFWQNIDRLARAFGHELTISMHGELKVVPDPHILPTAAQASEYSLPTQRPSGVLFDFSPARYQKYTLPAERAPQSYWFNALGLIATDDLNNAAVVGCIAPGNAPGFGTGDASRTDFLVTSQDELNVWAANHFAATEGTPLGELTLEAVSPVTIFDLSTRGYVTVDLPEDITERYDLDGRWTVERVEYGFTDYQKTATYYLKKEVVASRPARTIPQVTDASLDQSWDSFDTSISPTTGEIVQGIENMALTQPQLEQSLKKTRLKVYLSQLETDDAGNSPDPSGGDDPTIPTDPNDPEAVYLAMSYKNGGYYNAARRLSEFIAAFATFYGTVSAAPNVKDLLEQYIEGYLIEVPPGAAAAWASYIVDTPDTTFPTISTANRDTLAQYMFCSDSAKSGLLQFIISTIAASLWPRWNAMSDCVSPEQLAVWYQAGISNAYGGFTGYFCYLFPPYTITLNTTQIHATTVRTSTLMNWGNPAAGSRRLVQMNMSGQYTTGTLIKDSLYVYDTSTSTATLNPLVFGTRDTSVTPDGTYTFVGGAPPYSPTGVYAFTVRMVKAGFQVWTAIRYRLQDTRSASGTGTGNFTAVFTDLGRYDY